MKKTLIPLLMAALILTGCTNRPPEETVEPTVDATIESETVDIANQDEETVEEYRHPLTGRLLDEEFGNARPYAVMVNNISVAMPQCGIAGADIIYEVLAEGGITRMMALFTDISSAGALGSIRSVRPYYIDLANSYDAILVHAGGSDDAYAIINSGGIDNMDGVWGRLGEEIFYRDQSRMGSGYEHSLFTNSSTIIEYTSVLGLRDEHYGTYDYLLSFIQDAAPADGSSAQSIRVDFSKSKSTYFEYSPDNGAYAVKQHGSDYIDGNTGERLYFENVLIIAADTYDSNDSYAHISVDFNGSGDGCFANGGKLEEITWNRYGSGAFSYTDAQGNPLELGIGKTFICVVRSPIGGTVTYE